jgi:hypothetical protein
MIGLQLIPTRLPAPIFLPPWKQILAEVETVMESYTEIGVPNVANRNTLDVLFMHCMGFTGVLSRIMPKFIIWADTIPLKIGTMATLATRSKKETGRYEHDSNGL